MTNTTAMTANDLRQVISIISQEAVADSAATQSGSACNLAEAGISRRRLLNAIEATAPMSERWDAQQFLDLFDGAAALLAMD